jgi:hypothetical protein
LFLNQSQLFTSIYRLHKMASETGININTRSYGFNLSVMVLSGVTCGTFAANISYFAKLKAAAGDDKSDVGTLTYNQIYSMWVFSILLCLITAVIFIWSAYRLLPETQRNQFVERLPTMDRMYGYYAAPPGYGGGMMPGMAPQMGGYPMATPGGMM